MKIIRFTLIISLILYLSCREGNKENLDKEIDAKRIIEKSIEVHGGMQNYKNIQYFGFEKTFSLFKADGSVEDHKKQLHEYYPLESSFQINWKERDTFYSNSQHGDNFSQQINTQKNLNAEAVKIKSAINASVFTIFLPWKILDSGSLLSFDGEHTLSDGTEVFVVKVEYNPNKHDNHTQSDIWWHYFNKKSYIHEGYTVALSDHTSTVRNLSFQTVNGFIFPKRRKSWRVNETGEKEYLRASYEYKELSIK